MSYCVKVIISVKNDRQIKRNLLFGSSKSTHAGQWHLEGQVCCICI